MPRILVTLAGLALLSACATTPDTPRPEIDSLPEYREFLVELQGHIEQGAPRQLSPREMQKFTCLNNDLRSLIADTDDFYDLSESDRVQLVNMHEEMWVTVAGRDEEQIICRREHTMGTHFRETRCRTIAEIRASNHEAQSFMRRQMPTRITVDGAP